MVAKTQERMELLRELWGQPIRTDEIIDRLNALDGDHVRRDHAQKWASNAKVKRCPEMVSWTLAERATEMRATFARGYEQWLSETPERDMAFGGLIFTNEWPKETVIRLIEAWNKGMSTIDLGVMFDKPTNAIIGKIHRLKERGLVQLRPNPNISRRDSDDSRRNLNRRNVPRPKITLDGAMVVTSSSKATEAKRMAEPSPFDNMIYRPPPVAPVQTLVPPSRKCCYPLWADNAKPDHRYCDEPAILRSYCARHAKACYVVVRPFKDAA